MHSERDEPSDEGSVYRTTGEYVVFYVLAIAGMLAGVATLIFLFADLQRPNSSLLIAIASTIPGLLLVLSFLPGMQAMQHQHFWRAAGFAGLALLLSLVIGLLYIETLAAICGQISGCHERGSSLYVVATAQILLVLVILGALGGTITAVGVGISHRDPWR